MPPLTSTCAVQAFVETWLASSVTTARSVWMPPFLMTTSLRVRVPPISKVSTTVPLASSTSTFAVFTPPLTPAATREPERSTVKGLPALAGSGLAVMPQVGTQGLTWTVVVALWPPETAFTS